MKGTHEKHGNMACRFGFRVGLRVLGNCTFESVNAAPGRPT